MPTSTTLRPVRASDLALLHSWFNSDDAFGPYDLPLAHSLAWVESSFAKGHLQWLRLIEHEGAAVGWTDWTIDPDCEWIARLSIFICLPELRGRGVGGVAHRLLANEIFSARPTILKIEAWTDLENVAEQRALEGAGFEREGVLRMKWRHHGQFRDMCVYGKLR